MAAGFIVVKKNDEGVIIAYWDGTAFVDATVPDAIDESDFIPARTGARFVQGGIQTSNTEADVVYVAANSDVTLAP